MADLAVHTTPIPGLLVIDLPLHGDTRGWFKENWQRAKMTALGLPDFGPVQNNMSFNAEVGVTRGLHAEPWDKLISLATGRIFGAWVDLRPGTTFGTTFTLTLGTDKAVYVPHGVANGYQALEPNTTYSYLVNDHWSPAARDSYTYLNLNDPTINIAWPLPLDQATISDADLAHPHLADVTPMTPRRTLIIGARGQLGQALQKVLPHALAVDSDTLDITNPTSIATYDWTGIGTIINAAAMTAVDHAETNEGRRTAWAVNVTGVAHLVEQARTLGATLVHISSDYVFDGTRTEHTEDEPFTPLGVYGTTKAAGDALVATWPQHYIIRTSWVIGEGHNFVNTMRTLAHKGIHPAVVNDQHGRLTFTTTLAEAITHLLTTHAPHGTYNVTNDGPTHTWHQIAQHVFELTGHDPNTVTPQTTTDFTTGKLTSPRPQHSTLTLDKIKQTGYHPPNAHDLLRNHLR